MVAVVQSMALRISELQQEVEMLRSRLQGPGPGNGLPPFVKPNRRKGPKPAKKVRRKREQAFTRKREEPDEEIPHAVEHCPDCGRALTRGWEHTRHQVIEIAQEPIRIIDHVLFRRRCGICGKLHLPVLGAEDGVVGQHRVGPKLMSFIATLCTDYRVPREGVQGLLSSLYGLHLSVGEITDVLYAVAKRGEPMVSSVLAEIRSAPHVHGDETGWREDGINGYLWSFSTPTARYFHRDKSRGADVAKGILMGEWRQEDGSIRKEECVPFSGVLICDFLSSYSWYPGPIQRCWDHLSRELKDLKEGHAEDAAVVEWVGSVFKVYERAKKIAARSYPEQTRREWRCKLVAELLALAKPYLADENAPQHTLAARIERFQAELLTFVQYAGVPSGNNPAERALRPTVIARKISGGTRSEKGSRTMSILRTLFGTWALRGRDTLQACMELLIGVSAPVPAAPT